MRARWLWLLAFTIPLAGGLLVVLVYSDTAAGVIVLGGWPLTTTVAGVAMWKTFSSVHWIAKAVTATLAALAMSLVIAPILFFTSYILSVVLFGDDDRTYF